MWHKAEMFITLPLFVESLKRRSQSNLKGKEKAGENNKEVSIPHTTPSVTQWHDKWKIT